ncbi:MAG: hypothetical protein ACYDIC_16385 [Desulfobaccales bacterium]
MAAASRPISKSMILVMGVKIDEKLKAYLQQKLSSTWAVILITLAVFVLSAYLPPPLKFLLWVLCLVSFISPIVRGIIRGKKDKD